MCVGYDYIFSSFLDLMRRISMLAITIYFHHFFRPDVSYIYVCVGYGFYVQFTLPEALRFIEKKSRQLTEQSDQLTRDAAKVKAHIKLVLQVSYLHFRPLKKLFVFFNPTLSFYQNKFLILNFSHPSNSQST